MKLMQRGLVPLGVLLATGMSAQPIADYQPLDRDAEPLRTAFNADAGKVRVLMLVAPT